MAFQWRADNGPIVRAYWVSISFESYMYSIPRSGLCFFLVFGLFQLTFNFTLIYCQHLHFLKTKDLKHCSQTLAGECLKLKKKIRMHIAQRKELDVHKTKRKRGRNRTTTSLVLDSSMQRGRWEFRLNQRIWLRLSSVFESRRISF